VQDIYTIGKTDSLDVNNTIIESYAGMMNQYLSEKSLIPADQLFEIGYSEFAANPVPVMRNIYETLQLGDFEECEKRMTNFVTAKKNYAVLKHRLTDAEIELVDLKWSKFMNYWNYLPYQSRSSS
jgi:omega-hydroxy-beta-dihydromenaquinone-9 sulfotransferase